VERVIEDLPAEIRKNPLVDRRKRITNVVYRIVDGKAVCTPVKAGPSDLTHSVVLEGIDEGDEIIIGPYKVLESIEHDELVKLEDETTTDEESEATGDASEAASADEAESDDEATSE